VVINAAKVKATGNKLDQKNYYSHSFYVGHLKATSLRDVLERNPELPIRHAVKGMLPHNVLGRQLLKKLKVYAGSDHPHAAQQPAQLSL
jgi:large subunit ribosomal protein L13